MAERRQRRGSASSGTVRLFFAFGTGLVGILYLSIALVPLLTGRVEVSATVTNMDTIEREGFPEASFLRIESANIVFDHANAWLTGRKGEQSLYHLTAPVVGDLTLADIQRRRAAGEPLDLTQLRLVVVLPGEMVRTQWPEVARRAVAEEPLDKGPVTMTLEGDTVVAKGQLSLPRIPAVGGARVEWAKARRLSHGVHLHSLGWTAKHLAIALILLALSFFTFRYHRRHPTRPSDDGLDFTPLVDDVLDL